MRRAYGGGLDRRGLGRRVRRRLGCAARARAWLRVCDGGAGVGEGVRACTCGFRRAAAARVRGRPGVAARGGGPGQTGEADGCLIVIGL